MDRVRKTLRDANYPWPDPQWVASTGSTNADLLSQPNLPDGTALIADEQTAGRGRLDRRWVSAPGAGIWCSVLLRTSDALLPLRAGLAVVDALAPWTHVQLKWPNDIWTDRGKLGGVLAEAGDGVAVGIGINVLPTPVPGAVALADLVDPLPDRESVLAALLIALARSVSWDPVETLERYRLVSATLGTTVQVELPGGATFEGMAVDLDSHGHLLVRTDERTQVVTAGDVVHATLRP